MMIFCPLLSPQHQLISGNYVLKMSKLQYRFMEIIFGEITQVDGVSFGFNETKPRRVHYARTGKEDVVKAPSWVYVA